jgi:hypothetical protein
MFPSPTKFLAVTSNLVTLWQDLLPNLINGLPKCNHIQILNKWIAQFNFGIVVVVVVVI